jgi:hypothetical protein
VKEAKGKRPEVEKEPARGGGEDVWSAQAEAEVAQGGGFPEHLVVMVNGLVGSADDWKFAAEQFVRRMPEKVIVHRSQCNSATQTFDGVDLMGERLANEVPNDLLLKLNFVLCTNLCSCLIDFLCALDYLSCHCICPMVLVEAIYYNFLSLHLVDEMTSVLS